MAPVPSRSRRGSRQGSSPAEQAAWRATYERTRFDRLPWFEPGPSPGVELAVSERFFHRGGKVLDIGCGAGSNVLFLAKRGYRAYGIDLSPDAIRIAKSRLEKARLTAEVREGDALALPFPNHGFDSLVDNGCFHTLPLPRRRRYVEEVCRVVRPSGSFVLAWVAREHTGPMGPTHRPSLAEVTKLLEPYFLFSRTEYRSAREKGWPSSYFAFLTRRSAPYPPPR